MAGRSGASTPAAETPHPSGPSGRTSGGGLGSIHPRELVLPSNVLSLARIPLAAAFAVAMGEDRSWIALGVLLGAGATDVADGWCARRLHQETVTGQVVDPFADKLFFLTAGVTLVLAGRLNLLGVLLLSTREIAQLVLAAVLAVRGKLVRIATGTRSRAFGKLTTTLQAATAAAALVWPIARPSLIAGTAVCGAAAAMDYWWGALASPIRGPRRRGDA